MAFAPGIILGAGRIFAAAVIGGNAVRHFPLLAVAVPVETLAGVDDPSALVDQIGVVIIAYPALAGARRAEAVHLPVADLELRAPPHRRDEEAAPDRARIMSAGAAAAAGPAPAMADDGRAVGAHGGRADHAATLPGLAAALPALAAVLPGGA